VRRGRRGGARKVARRSTKGHENGCAVAARVPWDGRCEGRLSATMNAPAFGASVGWTPLLDGDRREAALRMVDEIALALAELRPGEGPFSAIVHDAPALAVLFAYLSRARCSAQDGARAAQYLELAVEAAAATPLVPSFDGGLAGVGWAAVQLRRILGLELGDLCAAIDAALLDHLTEVGWSGTYDLVSGVVGVGASALERLPSPSAHASLDWIIGSLEQAARPCAGGITWWTDSAWLPPEQGARYPRGCHDLSVAHGMPGVAALLARAAAAGIQTRRARSLCEAATGWLEAHDAEYPSGLPYRIDSDAPTRPPPARLAWCGGDLGVAAVRMATARAAGRPDWADSARALARRVAARPHALSDVRDAGLCHGAAGVGHVFNRLYQATGAEALADAARFWFDQVLLLRQPARGIAGFAALVAKAGSFRWLPVLGLIDGVSGIALALLAAASPQEPYWDGILLLSNPERDDPL
jgi:lantibiotic biosynthesis protein